MSQIFSEAETVEAIAKTLIAPYHPLLSTAKFKYIFKEKASKKGGKPVLGAVKKVSPMMKFLIEVDFIMEIPLDTWNELDSRKRTALVDHLLERCQGEEDEQTAEMKWSVREPDVHEFGTILSRYGAWNNDLTGFVTVAKSVNLDFLEEDEEESEGEEGSEGEVEVDDVVVGASDTEDAEA